MAKLTGQTIADSYDQLLIVDGASGITSSLQAVESADTGSSSSALKISTVGIEVDTNFTGTTSATTKAAHIDFDATGITASGQTATNIGLDLDMNSNSPTMVGTVVNTGIDLDLTAGTSGTQTNVGVNIAVAGADTNYALITSGGSVGIGIAAPDGLLHVHKATAGSTTADSNLDLIIEDDSDTGIQILTPNENYSRIYFGDVSSASIGRIVYGGTAVSTAIERNAMMFVTAGSEAMRIDASGNVGIGTVATKKLSVEIGSTDDGGIDLSHSSGTVFARIGCVNPGVDNNTDMGSVSNNGLNILTNNTTRMHITNAGLVQIGGASEAPPTQLSVGKADGGTISMSRGVSGSNVAITDGGALGTIYFYGYDVTHSAAAQVGAMIRAEAADAWDTDDVDQAPTELQFFTNDNSNTSTIAVPRMTIGADGFVGIGSGVGAVQGGHSGQVFTLMRDTSTWSSTIETTFDSQGAGKARWASYDHGGSAAAVVTKIESSGNNDKSGNIHFYCRTTSDSFNEVGKFITNGDFYTNDGSVHDLSSDARTKKNVVDIEEGLDVINQLRPVSFEYNGRDEFHQDDGRIFKGFIADEVKEVAPYYMKEEKGKIDGVEVDDFKSLSKSKMIPMMVKAIQELSKQVEELKAKIN